MTESVHRHLAVLDAPSNLGLKPPSPGREPGVKNMPGVLRAHGIMQRLRAEDAGSVVPPPYAGALDPAIKVRNARGIRNYSLQLADRIDELLGPGKIPTGSRRRLQHSLRKRIGTSQKRKIWIALC
jgi:arginase